MIRCPHCHGPLTIAAASDQPTLRAVDRRSEREPLWPVIMAACEAFGAPISALLTGSRASHVVLARMVACYVLQTDHHLSLPAVGRLLECDHTTVHSAVRRFERIAGRDPRVDVAVARVRARWAQREIGHAAE